MEQEREKHKAVIDAIIKTVSTYYAMRHLKFNYHVRNKVSISDIAKSMVVYITAKLTLITLDEFAEFVSTPLARIRSHYTNAVFNFKYDIRFRREYFFLTNQLKPDMDIVLLEGDALEILLTTICEHYMTNSELVCSSSQLKEVAIPRHVFHYLARAILVPKPTEEYIGTITNRDRTTVIKSVRQINEWISYDKSLNADIANIIGKFRTQFNKSNN